MILVIDLFQGHIGENPFDNGSWGKEHFQPSTVPWQLNPRGHGRPSVSAFVPSYFTVHITRAVSRASSSDERDVRVLINEPNSPQRGEQPRQGRPSWIYVCRIDRPRVSIGDAIPRLLAVIRRMRQIYNSAGIGTLSRRRQRRRGEKEIRGGGWRNSGRLIVARQVARAASSQRAFSRRNRAQAAIYRHPLPEAAPYGPTTVRPPSYVRARSPALVLSPGIYNTLCFPSAICLESSTPSSLTLLSRVLFLVIIPRARAPRPLFPPPHPSRSPSHDACISCRSVGRRALTSARLVESGPVFF